MWVVKKNYLWQAYYPLVFSLENRGRRGGTASACSSPSSRSSTCVWVISNHLQEVQPAPLKAWKPAGLCFRLQFKCPELTPQVRLTTLPTAPQTHMPGFQEADSALPVMELKMSISKDRFSFFLSPPASWVAPLVVLIFPEKKYWLSVLLSGCHSYRTMRYFSVREMPHH